MDKLRATSARAERGVKAATFRLNAAQTKLTACDQAFRASLTTLKAGSTPEAKKVCDEAMTALKSAKADLDAAQAELNVREEAGDKAKHALTDCLSTRPRRNNKFGEVAQFADQAGFATDPALSSFNCRFYQLTIKDELSDPASMTAFPEPPAEACGKFECIRGRKERKLEACECNIRQAFANLSKKELIPCRNNLRVERFAACPESVRADCQAKAKEVYAVVNAMYNEMAVYGKGSKDVKGGNQAPRGGSKARDWGR